MQTDYMKFIKKHNIPGGLLREFVSKELWSAACDACDTEIARCEEQVLRLKELKIKLRLEEKR